MSKKIRGEVRELLLTLSMTDTAALVCCGVGKPFADQRTVKRLHKLGLVKKTSWSLTSLGEEVVAKLTGTPFSKRVEPSSDELERFAEWVLREHNVIHRREPLVVSGFSNETYRDPKELLEAYRDAETAEENAPEGKFKVLEGHEAAEARTLRDTVCSHCNDTLKKDAECVWVSDQGIFHPECVEPLPTLPEGLGGPART